MLGAKKWVKINKFPKSLDSIRGVFEIENTLYIVRKKGISSMKNNTYQFLSDEWIGMSSCEWGSWETSCLVGNCILKIYMKDYDRCESTLFNTNNKKFSELKILTNRKYFGVIHYLHKVWIVGGDDRNHKKLDTIQTFDLINKTTSLPPIKMIKGRCAHKVIVYNSKLFVFGGVEKGERILNSVEMYSPDINKFVMMAPMKTARYDFACCRVGNLVYVIGGSTGFGVDDPYSLP